MSCPPPARSKMQPPMCHPIGFETLSCLDIGSFFSSCAAKELLESTEAGRLKDMAPPLGEHETPKISRGFEQKKNYRCDICQTFDKCHTNVTSMVLGGRNCDAMNQQILKQNTLDTFNPGRFQPTHLVMFISHPGAFPAHTPGHFSPYPGAFSAREASLPRTVET